MEQKVFCIGFQKTGTSSIGKALKILGYQVHKGFRFNRPGKVQIPEPVTREKLADVALPITKGYNAFEDNPWCLLFRELDAAYPNSKFILTRRETQSWSDSFTRHFIHDTNPTLRFIYGCDSALERPRSHFASIYEAHNAAVLEYFRDRPSDLLVFDLESANWDDLCAFLGRRRPWFRAYPHKNAAVARERQAAWKAQWSS